MTDEDEHPAAEERIAAELVAARRSGQSLPGFPGVIPATMTEAYRIQDQAIASWPDSLAGWKIGFIPADRRSAGEPDRLVGPIWRQQVRLADEQTSATEMSVFTAGFAAVEAELVLRLGTDLRDGDGWTSDEAASLDQELLVGIEVASSPIPDINALGPTVIAADFGNNNGLVVGPVLPFRPTDNPVLTCSIDGQLIGEGSGENLPGGIHHGLATALNILAGRGHEVRAGMVFATGAITGIHPIGAGQHCRVEVRGGPSLELRATDAAARPSPGDTDPRQ